jgi:uncharacterized protein with PhoU and TrkA domain
MNFFSEPIVKITINENCDFINKFRKEIHFRSQYGVDLIVIRRNEKWLFEKDVKIQKGDILIVKGEKQPIMELKEKACDLDKISFNLDPLEETESPFDVEDPEIKETIYDLKQTYVKITDISETMTELALAALFFNNYEVAEDVLEMEELMDGLNISFEKDLLEFAHLIENPRDLTGIMRIVFSCELISDAAENIAESVVKGFEAHQIIQKAIEETREIVVRETLSEDSYFKGKTYKELQNSRYKRGFHIIALKREKKWIYSFKPEFIFQEGDLLIGLGPQETVEQWRKCVNPEKYDID